MANPADFIHSSNRSLSSAFNLPRDFRTDFELARDMINNSQYADAINILARLVKDDPENANLNFLLGYCYFQTQNLVKAQPFFEKAIINAAPDYNDNSYKERAAPVYSYYYLGSCYHWMGKYQQARTNIEKFKSFLIGKNGKLINQKNFQILQDVNRKIDQIISAIQYQANPVNVMQIKVPYVNAGSYSSYGAQLDGEGTTLYLTRKRLINDRTKADLYVLKKRNQTWGRPELVGGNINSSYNDYFSSISADGKFLLFSSDRKGAQNVFYSLQDQNRWTDPFDNLSINSNANETYAVVTKDGNQMYFVSDRPGGYGGKDIYKIEKKPDGSWSQPENLGFMINTPYDEETPWPSNDGNTLYFSSEGHATMGGFDVFVSHLKNGMWLDPENLGIPVNSPGNDYYYRFDEKNNLALLSSNRNQGDKYEVLAFLYPENNTFVDKVFAGTKDEPDVDTSTVTDKTIRQNLFVEEPSNQIQNSKKDTIGNSIKQDKNELENQPIIRKDSASVKKENQPKETKPNPEVKAMKEKALRDSINEVNKIKAKELQKEIEKQRLEDQRKEKLKADSIQKLNAKIKLQKLNDSIATVKLVQDSLKKEKERIAKVKAMEVLQQSEKRKADSLAAVNAKERQELEKRQAEEQQQKILTEQKKKAEKANQDSLKREKERIAKERQELEKRQAEEQQQKTLTEQKKKAEKANQDSLKKERDRIAKENAVKAEKQKEAIIAKAKAEKLAADKKAREEKLAADKKAREEKLAADKKAKDILALKEKNKLLEKKKQDSINLTLKQTKKINQTTPKTNSSSTGNQQLSGSLNPCDSATADRNKGYTVQVGAGFMKIKYFDHLRNKKICYGRDGLARFIVGDYATAAAAEKIALGIRGLGYPDAWVHAIDNNRCYCTDNELIKSSLDHIKSDQKNNVLYTIQVGAGAMKVKYFKNLQQVRVCKGSDGIIRFTFGVYDNRVDAEKARDLIIKLGYTDAWISVFDENHCSETTSY